MTLDILKEQLNEEDRSLHVGEGLRAKRYPCYQTYYLRYDIMVFIRCKSQGGTLPVEWPSGHRVNRTVNMVSPVTRHTYRHYELQALIYWDKHNAIFCGIPREMYSFLIPVMEKYKTNPSWEHFRNNLVLLLSFRITEDKERLRKCYDLAKIREKS